MIETAHTNTPAWGFWSNTNTHTHTHIHIHTHPPAFLRLAMLPKIRYI